MFICWSLLTVLEEKHRKVKLQYCKSSCPPSTWQHHTITFSEQPWIKYQTLNIRWLRITKTSQPINDHQKKKINWNNWFTSNNPRCWHLIGHSNTHNHGWALSIEGNGNTSAQHYLFPLSFLWQVSTAHPYHQWIISLKGTFYMKTCRQLHISCCNTHLENWIS